jgi:hypothetical protein
MTNCAKAVAYRGSDGGFVVEAGAHLDHLLLRVDRERGRRASTAGENVIHSPVLPGFTAG